MVTDSEDRKLVLVVDDEEMVRETLKQMLSVLGWSVLEAETGLSALEICASDAAALDLVLLDLSIPGLTARETYLGIRGHGVDCPIMLMSGYDNETAALRFGGEPIAGFLQKPFSLEELKETVAQALT